MTQTNCLGHKAINYRKVTQYPENKKTQNMRTRFTNYLQVNITTYTSRSGLPMTKHLCL